ncbi:MAG: HEPN domain-containing protein [Nanoarchaeota archaeon]
MLKTKPKLDWCLDSEKRMRMIPPNNNLSKGHIAKARHNLNAADYNAKGGYDDWTISQAYYAMYHGLLAILFKKGFESKNHECTINAIEYLMETKQISFSKEDLAFIRTAEQMTTKDAKSLREEFQYGTQTVANKAVLSNMLKVSKDIVERIELMLNEL